jgi:hypothetical protein
MRGTPHKSTRDDAQRNEGQLMLITTATILTEQVQIHVGSDGEFTARTQGGETLARADSLKRVKRLARFELKKKQVRVAVPFTMIDYMSGKLTNAIAKGRHAGRHDTVLIWVDDGTENGRSDTISLYRWGASNQYLMGNLPAKSLKRIDYLFDQKRKTEERAEKIAALIEKWRDEHTINLAEVLDAALQEAAEAMTEDDDEPEESELDTQGVSDDDNLMELELP